MPCATPPCIWPARIIGLITVPQSCTTTYFKIFNSKVRGSISTIMAWTPFAVAPILGPKYWVDSRPGSVPGSTAPRIGLAWLARSPSLTNFSGIPTIDTLPSSITRSSSEHSNRSLASFGAFDITGNADAEMAALQACRGLLVPKRLVPDRVQRHVEHRLVVAAIVFKHFKILIDDFVVVGEGIRRNQIPPPDFGRVD